MFACVSARFLSSVSRVWGEGELKDPLFMKGVPSSSSSSRMYYLMAVKGCPPTLPSPPPPGCTT